MLFSKRIHKYKLLIIFLEHELKELENSAQIFNALSDIPGDIDDVELLFKASFHSSILMKIFYTDNEQIKIFINETCFFFRHL